MLACIFSHGGFAWPARLSFFHVMFFSGLVQDRLAGLFICWTHWFARWHISRNNLWIALSQIIYRTYLSVLLYVDTNAMSCYISLMSHFYSDLLYWVNSISFTFFPELTKLNWCREWYVSFCQKHTHSYVLLAKYTWIEYTKDLT